VKRVVSVSLGSSKRDHKAMLRIESQPFCVERIGTDGSIPRAIELIQKLDGHVDAFGMGGIDLRVVAGDRDYFFRDAQRIARSAIRTPIVDGSGLKNTLERRIIEHLNRTSLKFRGKKVLLVSSVDRFGMAETMSELGADMVLGDLMFGLGIPIPIRTLAGMKRLARVVLPVVTKLPFTWLYPTGDKQDEQQVRFEKFYQWADVIAGDYHYIRRYMPSSLKGKIILTNTVTTNDINDLRARQAASLIATTPSLGGRSFGTNVMEAIVIASLGKHPDETTPALYDAWLDKVDWAPRVEVF
jgi:hypothetical protein